MLKPLQEAAVEGYLSYEQKKAIFSCETRSYPQPAKEPETGGLKFWSWMVTLTEELARLLSAYAWFSFFLLQGNSHKPVQFTESDPESDSPQKIRNEHEYCKEGSL